MAFCRTKSGKLPLVWEGEYIVLDEKGMELSEELAEDIRPHINVIVEESKPVPAAESEESPKRSYRRQRSDEE